MIEENQTQNVMLETKTFARKYLAKYLKVDSDEIESLSIEHPQESGILVYDGKRYSVKVSNPISVAKEKNIAVWDFDLRGNIWMNGRNVKTKKEKPKCDFYLLIGRPNKYITEPLATEMTKVFLMQAESVPNSHVRISLSGHSKYYKYAI